MARKRRAVPKVEQLRDPARDGEHDHEQQRRVEEGPGDQGSREFGQRREGHRAQPRTEDRAASADQDGDEERHRQIEGEGARRDTLGFATIVTQVALAWQSVTGGGIGVPGLELPAPFDTGSGFFLLCLALAAFCTWMTANIADDPHWRWSRSRPPLSRSGSRRPRSTPPTRARCRIGRSCPSPEPRTPGQAAAACRPGHSYSFYSRRCTSSPALWFRDQLADLAGQAIDHARVHVGHPGARHDRRGRQRLAGIGRSPDRPVDRLHGIPHAAVEPDPRRRGRAGEAASQPRRIGSACAAAGRVSPLSASASAPAEPSANLRRLRSMRTFPVLVPLIDTRMQSARAHANRELGRWPGDHYPGRERSGPARDLAPAPGLRQHE